MVRVPTGEVDPTGHAPAKLDDFFIDKFEVTNALYKEIHGCWRLSGLEILEVSFQ
jgi:hypothetical protein